MKKKNKEEELWIDKFLRLRFLIRIKNKTFFSFFLVLFPSIILLTPFIMDRFDFLGRYTFRMWLGLGSGAIWIGLGPVLISHYAASLKCTLDTASKNKIIRSDTSVIYKKCIIRLNRPKLLGFLWIGFIVLIVFADISYLRRFGIDGYSDPLLYVFAIIIVYILYFTSIGIIGAIDTMKLISGWIENNEILLDYYNSDKMAGLRCIKNHIFKTSKLFATGALFFPILLDYIIYTNNILVKVLLYLAILSFTIVLVLSFLIPIRKLYRHANALKDDHLDYLGERFSSLTNDFLSRCDNYSLENELAAINFYYLIDIVSSTSLFKVTPDVYMQIFGAILIPLFTFFLNSKDIISVIQIILK